jgi:hypothetical protein
MEKSLVVEMMASMLAPKTFAEELPDTDPMKVMGTRIAGHFTGCVEFLRSSFPNENVRKLATLLWDVCGSRSVPLAVGPKVPSLHFGLMGGSAVIFAPDNWSDLIKENPILQMGGVVCIGTQAVDWWAGKITTQEEAQTTGRRAQVYEAEYLLAIKKQAPGHKFNDYQKRLLAEYPKGFAGVPDLFYELPKFVAAPSA